MAVTFATGFEALDDNTDQITLTGSAGYFVSLASRIRTGAVSMELAGTLGSPSFFTIPSGNYTHFAMAVLADSIGGDRVVFGSTAAGTINLRLTAAQTITIYVGTTLIGTSSAITFSSTAPVFYWVGVRQVTGTSTAFLQINGVDAVVGTATVTAQSGNIGTTGSEGVTLPTVFDDVVVDSAGFLPPCKVDIAFPISDGTVTGVTAGAGGTTGLWQAVDNTPPAGVASASETNTTNIRFPASTAAVYKANLQSYTALGLASVDTVIATQGIIRHGEDVASGTKNGTYVGTTNPTQTDSSAFTFGGDAGAHGDETGTTLWVTKTGTMKTSGLPTSGSFSTSPTIEVDRASEIRVGCIDFMGMLVVWTPGAPTLAPGRVPLYRRLAAADRRVM